MSNNPYTAHIKTLRDAGDLSFVGAGAIEIMREHMKCDPGHDEGHLVRVLRNTLWFGEGGNINVMVPAAVLHDIVNLSKDHPDRASASRLSASKAVKELESVAVPGFTTRYDEIYHAIEAHSWSANVLPMTLEAKALQDADRIDSLGAIGIARLFAVGGSLGRTLFHPTDPFAKHRPLDESTYSLDHYFVKLNNLHSTMQTERGQIMAAGLTLRMNDFVLKLVTEINPQ